MAIEIHPQNEKAEVHITMPDLHRIIRALGGSLNIQPI